MQLRLQGVSSLALLWLLSPGAMADWRHDFEAAMREAKSRKAPVLVHFYADWCPPCRQMESQVLNTASVSALVDKVIAVKLNSDHNRELVRRFGVTSLPSDVVLSPDGRVRNVYSGSTSLPVYESRLRGLVPSARPNAKSVHSQPEPLTRTQEPNKPGRRSVNLVLSPATPQSPTRNADLGQISEPAPSPLPPTSPAADESQYLLKMTVQFKSRTACVVHNGSGEYVGLSGYSPVSLNESRWTRGEPRFADSHEGVVYWFRSQQELDKFRRNPDRFTPALRGCDPVGLRDRDDVQVGAIEFAATYSGRTYFFTSAANRDTFVVNPDRYSTLSRDIRFGPS